MPVVSPSSPTKIWGKLTRGFLSYDRRDKQSERHIEITTKIMQNGRITQ